MSLERANEFHHFQPITLIAGIAFSVSLLLTSCGSIEIEPTPTRQALNETALTFETIEQKDWPSAIYSSKEPGVMIITSQEDISNLQVVSDETIRRLQELDYESSFALIVFQGQQGSGGYSVNIELVTRDGMIINVYAQFQAPKPEDEKIDLVTSPYHTVQIQKNGKWDQDFLIQVIVDDKIVASQNHFIP